MKPAYGRQSFLVVFDFDHTVCDCNTDEVIPAQLGRTALQKKIIVENNILNANYGHDDKAAAKVEAEASSASSVKGSAAKRIQWTKLMDTIIAPFGKEELQEAAKKSVFVADGMRDVFDFLTTVQEKNSFFFTSPASASAGDDVAKKLIAPNYLEINIASDSNLLFIESALDATMPGVRERISQIHSNPYYSLAEGDREACPVLTEEEKEDEAARDVKYNPDMTERKSRLLWYERNGNGCEFCAVKGNKPNMCKSKIIKKLLNTTTLIDPTVIFVGDGGNDYCPVLNVLRPRDFVFVRRGFPLHKMLSTGKGGEHGSQPGEKLGGCCSIGLWQDPKELLSLFQAVLESLPFQRLPTLTRFLDVPSEEKEFRAVTLRKRMADIVRRTLKENESTVSPTGRAALEALAEGVANNAAVPPLPGQRVVPAWLRNYALVSEYPGTETAAAAGAAKADLEARAAGAAAAAAGAAAGEAVSDRVRNVSVAPRWGQVPWLHGEIYFYHLLWQYVMLKDAEASKDGADSADGNNPLLNYVSPYDILNPLYSQACEVAQTQGMISAHDPSIPLQSLSGDFIVTAPRATTEGTIARVVGFEQADTGVQAVSEPLPFDALTDPEGNGVFPGVAADEVEKVFHPYHDIFRKEKRDVLVNFIGARVVPMLATRPWVAPRHFCGTLLRWMLWGNGLDLSMFTVDQLAKEGKAAAAAAAAGKKSSDDATHEEAGGAAPGQDGHPATSEKLALLMKLREEEATAAAAQDTNVVGNDVEPLAKYLRQLLSVPDGELSAEHLKKPRDLRAANYHLDIVMDNVGVECIADLCLGLWFLHHAEKKRDKVLAAVSTPGAAGVHEEDRAAAAAIVPSVTYHVKPQPYYVSDVTPRDFEEIFSLLEQSYAPAKKGDKALTKEQKQERKVFKKVLAPFVKKARAAFASGAFAVDADTVWTQPSEYRDLPPRVMNRYFYTQTCVGADGGAAAAANISPSLTSRAEVHAANKTEIEAKTALVIFKGDLNFRRVIGDRFWERSDYLTTLAQPDEDLKVAIPRLTESDDATHPQSAALSEVLRDTPAENVTDAPTFREIVSAYWPVRQLPVVCVRTIKSEGCIGVSGERKATLDKETGSRAWRVSGKYGVILFAH